MIYSPDFVFRTVSFKGSNVFIYGAKKSIQGINTNGSIGT